MKIGLFSDIHLGVHQDSPLWHQIALDFASWAKEEFQKRGVDTILIGGDIFHNRHEVNVNTLHVAHQFFNILKDFEIHAIVGNHDARQKHSSLVNSIEILQDRGDSFKVYATPQKITLGNQRIVMAPWGVSSSELPTGDVLLGHFEIKNFKMSTGRVCEDGIDAYSLLNKAPLVLTGHFHLPERREYPEGVIVYLGSPMELDFGDLHSQKGIYVLEGSNLDFIPNNISPKHKRLYLSKLLKKEYDLKKEVPGSLVALCLDQDLEFEVAEKLMAKLQTLNPLQLRMDKMFTSEVEAIKVTDAVALDLEQAFSEFTYSVTVPEGISNEDVLKRILEFWKQCQN